MMFRNPGSKRENPFRKIYDDEGFRTVLRHKDDLPSFPYILDIELTNHCNLSCVFCGQQAMTREKGFISDEMLRKAVDECAKYGTPIRLIRWGEPFLHPNIIDFCRYIKSKGLLLHITNNGVTLKEEQMRSLVELGVDSVIFSFQGATKEQYELMRNHKRYDELKANVLKLVEVRGDAEKPFIHISSTMTNETEDEISAFVDYWGNIVDSVGVGKTNLNRLSTSQVKSFEMMGKIEVLKKQETIKKCYRPCTEVYQKLSLDWDGKVSCCCSDFDNYLTVGHLKDSSLYDIWNTSERLRIFRRALDKNMHKCLTLCATCFHTYDEF